MAAWSPTISRKHLNTAAQRLVDELIELAPQLRVASLDDGVNVPVIDCGIKVPGSLEAGRRVAEICLAGQGTVRLANGNSAAAPGPAVEVATDDPVAACMASQYAGWQISVDDFFAMGSGPMRAAAAKEELFQSIGFTEQPNHAVGVLETRKFPEPFVCQRIAGDCDLPPRQLTLLLAPTASLVGTFQVVARSVETALHKLHELGFDLKTVISGFGRAPLPPIAENDLAAIGRTNDAVLYGGEVDLWVDADDEVLAELVPKVPSSASGDHGRPFVEIFKSYDHDFYKIDPHLFSPAVIRINNVRSGRLFTAGEFAPEVLRSSFSSPA